MMYGNLLKFSLVRNTSMTKNNYLRNSSRKWFSKESSPQTRPCKGAQPSVLTNCLSYLEIESELPDRLDRDEFNIV